MNRGYTEKAWKILVRIVGKKEQEQRTKEIKESLKLEQGHWEDLLKPS
jgi:hypothetical protein